MCTTFFITNHFLESNPHLHKDGEKQKGRPKKRAKNNHLAEVISSGPVISLNEKVNAPLSLMALFHGSNLVRLWGEGEGEEPGTCPLPHRTHRGEGQWGNLDLLSLWYPGVGRRDNVATSLNDKTAWQCLVIQFSPCNRTNNPHLDCIACGYTSNTVVKFNFRHKDT